VALPIGISFYTFQQIAYLVDLWRGDEVDRSPLRYAAFVTFFPHLIAGPIVHHRELTSQFPHLREGRLLPNLAVGITVFTIGLAKKVMIADTLARTASPVFDAAAAGAAPGLIAGWLAVLAYGLQIYFDFSGYSDMAIGLARMFGIQLPINFASPYRARSIVEFWRRWHITLSRFLRVYLYVPLGGNRRGPARRLANVMLTMVLGGLWHGAGWSFALWGALHGSMLVAAHAWRMARLPALPAALAAPLTLLGVMLAWVPFRAADLGTTGAIYAALLGGNGLGTAPPSAFDGLAAALALRAPGLDWALPLAALPVGVALGIALLAPNTQTLMRRFAVGLPTPGYETGIEERASRGWSPGLRTALLTGAALAACLMMSSRPSEFIYFQF
jgi:D-alanyl-lipoteichoic acid acyltransferase DltB (MBOAT superfamily)